MNDEPTNFPLCWPSGYERTKSYARKQAAFGKKNPSGGSSKVDLTVNDSCSRLRAAISAFTKNGHPWRIDPDEVIISTNLRTRLDGYPLSNQRDPDDVGVAVYFELDEKATVLCCDKWDRVADNIAAIAATLEAMRSLERWGVTESERVFTGFAALPEKAVTRTCWEVLGISPTRSQDAINEAWRALSKAAHPDRPGGSHDAMTRLNAAREEALKQCP